MRVHLASIIAFVAIGASADVLAETRKSYNLDFELAPGIRSGERVLAVHLQYDYPHIRTLVGAKNSLAMVTELYSADLSFVGHRHEVRDVSANGNHAVLAELPVRMDSRGFFEASVKLNFIADDIHVVDGGEFTFYWKNVGSGPELISAREYNTWLARTPVRTAPSTANLESGDVPGERVIHPPNAGHIPECGVDAVCPRRVR